MTTSQQLIDKLKSGTVTEKLEALDTLRASISDVVHNLISLIHSAEDKYIGWTLEGYDYERGEGQKTGFVLIESTIKEDCWYVFAATHLLIEHGKSSIDVVLKSLTHENPNIRAWAAFVLGDIGNKSAIPHLLNRLNVTNQTELWRICEALGKLGAVDAVPRLIELLADDEAGVDSVAATALGQIGDTRALEPLIEQFIKHKPSVYSISAALHHFGEKAVIPLTGVLFDNNAKTVHDLALMELGMIGDKRATDPIMRYLASAEDTGGKRAAITALGRLKAEQAVPIIAEFFEAATDFDTRISSSMALAEISNHQAFAVLVRELENGSPENQHDAALAFGNMESVENIEPLLNALKNGSANVRSAIAVSLGNLRDSRAIPALREALHDSDEYTRRYAQVGLDKISGTDDA
jgi:HEAT repeat protein